LGSGPLSWLRGFCSRGVEFHATDTHGLVARVRGSNNWRKYDVSV
jgi:hypothetical protein